MEIKQQFIPKSRTLQRPGYSMVPQFLTIHSTGNPDSTAQNEADYVCYNSTRQASYHFVCDEKQIIQTLPTNESGWHAGDGGKGTGNRKSIGIEICESGDRKKAVDNAVWLTRKLMKDFDIQPGNVFQHHHWSGKDCPRILRDKALIKDGIDWKYFTEKIREPEEEEMTQEQFNQMMAVYLTDLKKQAPGTWSEAERKWAEENGIIKGDESGMKYKAPITREEAVVMLHRVAQLHDEEK